MKTRVFILTAAAMIAFASNSLLCRAALKQTSIDPASFTFVRILSGAVVLWLIVAIRRTFIVGAVSDRRDASGRAHKSRLEGNWFSALALFVYAAGFSFAYVDLSAGTGALLLFGAVQATMILWGFTKGERLDALQIVGLAIALIGLVVLVFPGIAAPRLIGSTFMLSAGIAWGVYSLRGRSSTDAIAATTGNFLRAVPFAVVVSAVMLSKMRIDSLGITYGVVSGAITSGVGYVIWYAALSELKALSAATVQLSVPVLAATGGIVLLGESITLRYLIASIAVLGGIALVIMEKPSAES
ncbi:MAG TPA: DMT family transporter [Chthoniobacterales bacterium]|nr:DMT family transporter [Chthoniobacterales bacterium]